MSERVFDPVAFGRSIRVLLAELNIQQREAARMMGVDKCVLNRICKHGNPPSVENYLRIVGWMNKHRDSDGWKTVGPEVWAGTNFETREEKAAREAGDAQSPEDQS